MTSRGATKSIRSFFSAAETGSSNKKARVQPPQALEESACETPVVLESSAAPQTPNVSSPALHPIGWDAFDTMECSWRNRLSGETSKPYFNRLTNFLKSEKNKGAEVFPPSDQIFTALNLCPYDQVKVVVIGQDPYHGSGQAHGLAFSVQKGVQIPPSLRNMITEAMNDPNVHISKPTHGNLECWSRQGVLMLNTVLTVRKGQANSHQKQGWEEFTDAVVRELKKKEGLVYLLWGKPAQTKCGAIDQSKNTVITCSHPSPLSAYKTSEPFIGSKVFSRCNDALVSHGQAPIDWNIR